MKPGAVVADMSSIKPAEAQDHARRLAERHVHHIDAPVSGGTVGAEQGTLAIMAGGEPEAFVRVEPVLRAMGRPIHVGPHGAGQLAKLANQIIVGVTIGAVAEALLLAKEGELTRARCVRLCVAALPKAAFSSCTVSAWWSETSSPKGVRSPT